MRVTVEKGRPLERPRALTPEYFVTLAYGEDVGRAMKQAVRDMVDFLARELSVEPWAAGTLLSLRRRPGVTDVPSHQSRQDAALASRARPAGSRRRSTGGDASMEFGVELRHYPAETLSGLTLPGKGALFGSLSPEAGAPPHSGTRQTAVTRQEDAMQDGPRFVDSDSTVRRSKTASANGLEARGGRAMRQRLGVILPIVTALVWAAAGGAGRSGPAGGNADGGGGHLRQRAVVTPSLRRGRGRGPQALVREPAESRPQDRRADSHAGGALDGRGWRPHLEVPSAQRRPVSTEAAASSRRRTSSSPSPPSPREGSANSLAPEFRAITSMEIEDRHTIAVRFDKPSVAFGNKVTRGVRPWPSSTPGATWRAPVRRGPSGSPSRPGPGGAWSTSGATTSSTRRWRTTGGRCRTSSASCS